MFSAPRVDVEMLGPAAWYVYILTTLLALAGFLMLSKLMEKFPGQDLIYVFKKVFGNVAGSILSFLIGIAFFITSMVFLRLFTEAVKVYVYPLTSPSFIMIFFISAVLVMLYLGFETIARTAAVFLLPILFGLLIIYILGFPSYKVYNLFPILGFGIGRNVTYSIKNISYFGESLSLAVVLSSLQGNKYFRNGGLRGIAISGLLTTAALLVYIMAFPYKAAIENTIPSFAFTRIIELGAFFQRFDPIFLFVWSISAIIATAIFLYSFLSIYCKVFKIDDHRQLVLPLGIIVFCISIIIQDLSTLVLGLLPVYRKYAGIIYFGLPLLALLVATIRGQKSRPSGSG